MTQEDNTPQVTATDQNEITENKDNSQVGEDQNLGGQNEDKGQSNDENVNPQTPIVDPLQLIETLQIDPKAKETIKAGFLRQADYTKKTQDLAAERHLIEEYKGMKPYIDKVLSDPTLYEQVFGQKPVDPNKPSYPEDPVEYAQQVKNETLKAIQQEFDINQAEKVDPRLNTDQDFAYSVAGIVSQDKDFISGKKSATDATKEAVQRFDAFLDRQKEIWRKELNTQINKKRMIVPNQGQAISAGGTQAPKTMQEAAKLAETQLEDK